MAKVKPYESLRHEALEALAAGDPQTAFLSFRSVLEYPGKMESRDRWADALGVFARIGEAIAGAEFASKIEAAAADPDDVDALYELGYELVEQALPSVAATVLARAHELAPGQERLLAELAVALKDDGRYPEACFLLREASALLEQSFICRYLLAFNSLLTGDLDEPRALLPGLRDATDPRSASMTAQVEGMLLRADAVRGVSTLDPEDLRGWHFVLNGSLLLHLSPFGRREGMNGRYAWLQDSPALCLEGLRRTQAVLQAWEKAPPCVFELSDRESSVLAHAAATRLGLPLRPWQPNAGPGLIVAYDLGGLDGELLASLQEQRPGQLLWTHACCWTHPSPFASDMLTLLYQFNRSPWQGQLVVNQITHEPIESPPRLEPAAALADEVLAAALGEEALEDLPELIAFARAIRGVRGAHAPGAFSSGRRRRQWRDSPVPSNRFL
ncbi:MAG: hypothetical protein ACYCW6_19000 [Candidatus Xenobia bacterium]